MVASINSSNLLTSEWIKKTNNGASMMNKLPRKMSVKKYEKWIKKPKAKRASLPNFFDSGVKRTMNVLEGDAKSESFKRWRSFGARHYAAFQKNPTPRRAIALRNWGFDVKIPRGRGRK